MLIVSSPYIASTFRGMVQEASFIYYYLSGECYRNGTRAYLKLHPTAKYMSAKASASRLLKKPSVQQMLKRKLEKMGDVEKS
jgi:phage terminase small subunit